MQILRSELSSLTRYKPFAKLEAYLNCFPEDSLTEQGYQRFLNMVYETERRLDPIIEMMSDSLCRFPAHERIEPLFPFLGDYRKIQEKGFVDFLRDHWDSLKRSKLENLERLSHFLFRNETLPKIALYHTSLRDDCQSEDVAFTLDDKLRIAERLDELGVSYIEGGWPGSNPRDEEFFRASKKLRLKHARISAFGSTRRANISAGEDFNIRLLLKAETPVVTVVGKTWDLHVRDDLRISKKANLEVIADSFAYLKKRVDEVMFDAEHFFDGYAANPEYTIECVKAAAEAGADIIVLCDTRGGRLPHEILASTRAGLITR